jgi:hypothetical protein
MMVEKKVVEISLPLIVDGKFESKPDSWEKEAAKVNYTYQATFRDLADIIEAATRETARNAQAMVRTGKVADNTKRIDFTYGIRSKKDPKLAVSQMSKEELMGAIPKDKMMELFFAMQAKIEAEKDAEKVAQARMEQEENNQAPKIDASDLTDEQLEEMTNPTKSRRKNVA